MSVKQTFDSFFCTRRSESWRAFSWRLLADRARSLAGDQNANENDKTHPQSGLRRNAYLLGNHRRRHRAKEAASDGVGRGHVSVGSQR